MIIDAILDYKHDLEDWNKLPLAKRLRTERPRLNTEYIEEEARTFNFKYLMNIGKMYDYELAHGLRKYLDENGYDTSLADVVYA